MKVLLGDYKEKPKDERITIGIPRGLMVFYQYFQFWRTFFEELGFRVVLSSPTNRKLITNSLEKLQAETCFPAEVMHQLSMDTNFPLYGKSRIERQPI
ncbi:MAG: hypothetical protein AMS17_20875 [Spirochaetes bacterium DG_61]|nr:MAG: hypothetical protein AMS17_20875 [Spirochaetes bacterium DG_61]